MNPLIHEIGIFMDSAEVESQFLPPSVKPKHGTQSDIELEPYGDPFEVSQAIHSSLNALG